MEVTVLCAVCPVPMERRLMPGLAAEARSENANVPVRKNWDGELVPVALPLRTSLTDAVAPAVCKYDWDERGRRVVENWEAGATTVATIRSTTVASWAEEALGLRDSRMDWRTEVEALAALGGRAAPWAEAEWRP